MPGTPNKKNLKKILIYPNINLPWMDQSKNMVRELEALVFWRVLAYLGWVVTGRSRLGWDMTEAKGRKLWQAKCFYEILAKVWRHFWIKRFKVSLNACDLNCKRNSDFACPIMSSWLFVMLRQSQSNCLLEHLEKTFWPLLLWVNSSNSK